MEQDLPDLQDNTHDRTEASAEQLASSEHQIDMAAPVESVKEAVSKFGGIVYTKTHKIQNEEKPIHLELEKAEEVISKYEKAVEAAKEAKDNALDELDDTNRLIEELKLKLAKRRVEADGSSVKINEEYVVSQARHSTALAELKSVKDELEKLRVEYSCLVKETDLAVKRSEEAVSESADAEKRAEVLTLELIAAKASLDSANAAHLEAEEHRIKAEIAQTQGSADSEKELEKAQEELHKLNQQYESVNVLKVKLDHATTLLLNLKVELQAYKEVKPKGNQEDENGSHDGISSSQRELEELRHKIEKATTHLKYLKVASVSLRSELEREQLAVYNIKEREEIASNTVALLEADLNKTTLELESIQLEEEAKEVKELSKAKKEVELVKAIAFTIDRKLYAAQKETEAAQASERLALAAVKTLEDSDGKESKGVTLSLEEYQALSKLSHDAEEQAKLKVEAAISQIQEAKASELKCLERLEEANTEKAAKREELRIATEKAEKAKDEELEIDVELGRSRSSSNNKRSLENPENVTLSNEMETDSSSETEVLKKKKKKKPLFPQIVTFLARRKVQATKVV